MVMFMPEYQHKAAATPEIQAYIDALKQSQGSGGSTASLGRFGDTGAVVPYGPRSYDVPTIQDKGTTLQELLNIAIASDHTPPATYRIGTNGGLGAESSHWTKSGGLGDLIHPGMSDPNLLNYDTNGMTSDQWTDPGAISRTTLERDPSKITGWGYNHETPTDLASREAAAREYERLQAVPGFGETLMNIGENAMFNVVPGGQFVNAARQASQGNYLGAALAGLSAGNQLNAATGSTGMSSMLPGSQGNFGINTNTLNPGNLISAATGVTPAVGNTLANTAIGGITGGMAGAIGGGLGSLLKSYAGETTLPPAITTPLINATQAGISGGVEGVKQSLANAGVSASVDAIGIHTGNQAADGIINGLLKAGIHRAAV